MSISGRDVISAVGMLFQRAKLSSRAESRGMRRVGVLPLGCLQLNVPLKFYDSAGAVMTFDSSFCHMMVCTTGETPNTLTESSVSDIGYNTRIQLLLRCRKGWSRLFDSSLHFDSSLSFTTNLTNHLESNVFAKATRVYTNLHKYHLRPAEGGMKRTPLSGPPSLSTSNAA